MAIVEEDESGKRTRSMSIGQERTLSVQQHLGKYGSVRREMTAEIFG